MIGVGAITILCSAPVMQCALLETAAMEAVAWWAAIEPRAELTATIVADLQTLPSTNWAFTVEWTNICGACAVGLDGRILIGRTPHAVILPHRIAHEMGHIFGAVDEFPECPYGRTIMCTLMGWFSNSVSDQTREAIGWGDFPVHRVYLPMMQ